MTDNKNLKDAIRAAKEISGLSYVEQRKGTLLEAAGYTEEYIPEGLDDVMTDCHNHFGITFVTPEQYDEFSKEYNLDALFKNSDGLIEEYGSWNSFMTVYGEKAFNGVLIAMSDFDENFDGVSEHYEEKVWGSRFQSGMTEELYQAIFTAGSLVHSEHGAEVPEGTNLNNEESVKLLGSDLAARWAEGTNVPLDSLVLGWGELKLLVTNHLRHIA